MADLGEGTLCPLLFLDQTEAQRAKKIFLGGTGPPLSKVLDKLNLLSTQINMYCLMTNQMPVLLVQCTP